MPPISHLTRFNIFYNFICSDISSFSPSLSRVVSTLTLNYVICQLFLLSWLIESDWQQLRKIRKINRETSESMTIDFSYGKFEKFLIWRSWRRLKILPAEVIAESVPRCCRDFVVIIFDDANKFKIWLLSFEEKCWKFENKWNSW